MSNGSIGMGANAHSPPNESVNGLDNYFPNWQRQPIDAWVEVWDYASGSSFRGFVGGKGDTKSLFAFFDSSVVGREQKQGYVEDPMTLVMLLTHDSLMALIELAETVFAVTQVVICLDRSISEVDRKAFMKALRWVGFEAIIFDTWAGTLDATSDKWLFLGMEI